jgi:hypothetical protein
MSVPPHPARLASRVGGIRGEVSPVQCSRQRKPFVYLNIRRRGITCGHTRKWLAKTEKSRLAAGLSLLAAIPTRLQANDRADRGCPAGGDPAAADLAFVRHPAAAVRASDPASDSAVPGCSGSDWTFFNLLAEPFSPPITPNRNVGFGSGVIVARHFKGASVAEELVHCGAKIAEKITMYSSL